MLPSADGDDDDLAPAHSNWCTDRGITVLHWPAHSPDLNLIENLWGIVKKKMKDTRVNNENELKAAIVASWASIRPQQCHGLIASMPRRIDAVIRALTDMIHGRLNFYTFKSIRFYLKSHMFYMYAIHLVMICIM